MYYNNMYYEKYGRGNKSIIILPGWGETRKTFNNMIDTLKKNNTIYIIDYPGFGNSRFINKDLTIYDYSFIIYSFIKDNNIINPIIIAHSFGGRIVSVLIGKYKLKVNKLILLDVAGIKRFNIKVFFKKYLYKLLKLLTCILPLNYKYKIRKSLFKRFSSSDYYYLSPRMYNTFKNIVNENLYKYYKKINCNTLIIWGEKDMDTPVKDAYLLHKKIDNSKLVIYKHCTHFVYLENKDEVNNLINKYIIKEDY